MISEVFIIVTGEAETDTVVLVQDWGNSIKSESIYVVFLEEPSKIGEKEALNFIFGIIKEHWVPTGMIAFRSRMREGVICSVKHMNSVHGVIRCMWVNNVYNYFETFWMSSINQELEIKRCSWSRWDSKEACDMISKTGIIRVFLDSH